VTLTLTLREAPSAPVDAGVLAPDRLAGMSRAEIERLELRHGNCAVTVGDLFEVSGDGEEDVRVEGHARLTSLGAGMAGGRLVVTASAGDGAAVRSGGRADASTSAGDWCGARMQGGELILEGDAGDFAGAGMRGGMLVVRGSAGRRLGGELPGARMRGGEIVVHGDAGEEAGAGLRRGLIAVGGRAGAGRDDRRARWPRRVSRPRDAAGVDRRSAARRAAADLRARLLLPAAVPVHLPAPPARARAPRG
jgi:formylmethanofuran dehydrogenase subunit C